MFGGTLWRLQQGEDAVLRDLAGAEQGAVIVCLDGDPDNHIPVGPQQAQWHVHHETVELLAHHSVLELLADQPLIFLKGRLPVDVGNLVRFTAGGQHRLGRELVTMFQKGKAVAGQQRAGDPVGKLP